MSTLPLPSIGAVFRAGAELVSHSAESTGIDSANLRTWFAASQALDANGNPRRFYHGTVFEFEGFKDGISWVSSSAEQAADYAFAETDFRRAVGGEQLPRIIPVYVRAERPFNADGPSTRTVNSFFNEALVQAQAAGRDVDMAQATQLLRVIRAAASREESGPYYSTHDFWHEQVSLFGKDGKAAIDKMFEVMGFDSISFSEDGVLTYGVFKSGQLKSAIGNSGHFKLECADLCDRGELSLDLCVDKGGTELREVRRTMAQYR